MGESRVFLYADRFRGEDSEHSFVLFEREGRRFHFEPMELSCPPERLLEQVAAMEDNGDLFEPVRFLAMGRLVGFDLEVISLAISEEEFRRDLRTAMESPDLRGNACKVAGRLRRAKIRFLRDS